MVCDEVAGEQERAEGGEKDEAGCAPCLSRQFSSLRLAQLNCFPLVPPLLLPLQRPSVLLPSPGRHRCQQRPRSLRCPCLTRKDPIRPLLPAIVRPVAKGFLPTASSGAARLSLPKTAPPTMMCPHMRIGGALAMDRIIVSSVMLQPTHRPNTRTMALSSLHLSSECAPAADAFAKSLCSVNQYPDAT